MLLLLLLLPPSLMMAFLLRDTEALLHYQKLSMPRTSSSVSSSSSSSLSLWQMRLNPSSFSGTEYTITEFPRPALRRVPNAPIEAFADDDPDFQAKTEEMITVMYEAKGVGLAAPQIGLNENLFVYNPSGDPKYKKMERVVCNPTITKYSEEVDVQEEACLSLRSEACAGQVSRSVWIETEYQNELGQKVKRRLKGFEARVFQHEYDHLKGILCYDRYAPEDRQAVQDGINTLLGLYNEKDAQVEPDAEQAQAMQPPPLLTAKQMPPLEAPDKKKKTKKANKQNKNKSGFGAGGFGSGGKNTGKKKEKKKKG